MELRDIFVIGLAILLGIFILIKTGVLGGNKAAKKAMSDKQRTDSLNRNKKIVYWVLSQFESFAVRVGNGISEYKRTKYDYYVVRLDMRVPFLDRYWKPIELVGLHRMITFLSFLLFALGVSKLTFTPLLFFIVPCFIGKIREMIWESKVLAEDTELEEDFPDLFLILNPKLKMGANARIAPTLDEYTTSMDRLYSADEHLAIKKFVRLLRNLIETYSTEVEAIAKIRGYYKAASIVNFCNVAIQAMNGVDNREKLIAFEQELTNKKLALMRKRAEALVNKAQKATYLMYIILAEFVLLTMYTRIGGNFDALMGVFGSL